MATEPNPHITKAGRYALYSVAAIVGTIVLAILVNGCIRRPPRPATLAWGQGYDQGTQYMEPDHGFMYYWMWNQVLRSTVVQPTYHVYVPPSGAPQGYRPWQQREYYRDSAGRFTKRPAPSSGGFSATPKPAWSSSPIYTPKASPSTPSYTKPSSGGFTQSKPTYSAPRSVPSSSGFRSAPSRPSSGGFSSRPAPSRPSSGGFKR